MVKVTRLTVFILSEHLDPPIYTLLAVSFIPGGNDGVNGYIAVRSMIFNILHVLLVFLIEWMKEGVLTPIEFQWLHLMLFTELPVEGRGGFDPLPVQVEFHKAMIDENVTPHVIQQLPCGQVILDDCKTDP